MSERDFYLSLKTRYGGTDYALIPQVRNQTGYARKVRTADALAVSLWPSRGINVHGFEFKDSRADWLKELKEPAKAEEIGRFCAYWWLVVSDPKHFSPDELPAMWGAIHATEGKAIILKKAPRREPQEPSWAFVAAILRAAQSVVTSEVEIQQQVAAEVTKVREGQYSREQKALKEGEERGLQRYRELHEQVTAFEKASGVSLFGGWSGRGKEMGKAMKFVLDGGLAGLEGRLRVLIESCESIRKAAEDALTLEEVRAA